MPFTRLAVRVLCALSAFTAFAVLYGCSSGLNAVVQTFQDAVVPRGADTDVALNPRFQYIRVTVDGRPAYLALGYERASPYGPIRTYYSASKEVLEFQGGRLVRAAGLTSEWRNVELIDVPSWRAAAAKESGAVWLRMRDVMPGYRYGVRDAVTLKRIPAPQKIGLQRLNPGELTWFEELMTTDVPGAILPRAVYGVDMTAGREEPVYGEQCVSKDLCFTWQRWDVVGTADKRR